MYFHVYQSLLKTALQLSTGIREAERNSIETQSEKKREKTNTSLKASRMCHKKYTDKLHNCDMFDLASCLKKFLEMITS